MKILFMGTPEIAIAALEALQNDGQDIIAVVTAPDKAAGRGRKVRSSPVKDYALKHDISVLQPENLKSADFLAELSTLKPDLIVVVAFRMLPREVWSLPRMGAVNLHASLLPDYRGAAPINRVLMNGETETGVSTFFIEEDIDSGKIIMREPISILPDDDAGTLHDRVMEKGSTLLVKTVNLIKTGKAKAMDQSQFLKAGEKPKTAPKIFKEDCRIIWDKPVQDVHNHVRGLSPYPAAWTLLVSPEGEKRTLKIFSSQPLERSSGFPSGTLLTDGKSRFEVVCKAGILNITEVQAEGKKRMPIIEFMRGYKDLPAYRIE